MKTIQEYKAESTLNKKFRYSEGIMTRKEWINLQRVKGATVKEETKNRIQFNRTHYNRMKGDQAEYERKCNELVKCYCLYWKDNTSIEITKAEYDYFNNMELAEDIQTEKSDLSERIEAGIATEDEINEGMNKEFEFFDKYCK